MHIIVKKDDKASWIDSISFVSDDWLLQRQSVEHKLNKGHSWNVVILESGNYDVALRAINLCYERGTETVFYASRNMFNDLVDPGN